ncbi:hypothetical protein GCM10008904_09060 [Paraclostridium ghonii]|uniref:Uncharacterized protein n=1 Tax=Paraclostridium ghonii TaxID=29358 RepID=A0ABU0N200_9FIRM|nr:hypothetical protein [Paeniclostridium ghonii]MDQ0557193.1 hypothetical protein [Paeniclostridium ghonii]
MINIIYIYPNTDFINNEINICRIIDNKDKETIVVYGVRKNNELKIYITNTFTGDNKLVKRVKDVNKIIEFIEVNKDEIKGLENLEHVEKYILNKIG